MMLSNRLRRNHVTPAISLLQVSSELSIVSYAETMVVELVSVQDENRLH